MSIRQAFPPAKAVFAGVGVLLLVSGCVLSLGGGSRDGEVPRRLKMSLPAKTSSLTSSDASRVSSYDSKFTRRSHSLQR